MKNNKIPLGVYIHIPFCVSKCHYCDFCSAPAGKDIKERYVAAIVKEITSEKAQKYFCNHTVDTIYIGGGTPTCLSPQMLAEILNAVLSHYCVSDDTEITVECNPGTVGFEELSILKQEGVNRLSIGLQSIHDGELNALGRIHSFRDFDTSFNNARRAGIGNISLDLMYGIPLQTIFSFEQTLHTVIQYSPEHISAYSLKIEPGTNFYNNREKLILPDEDAEYNMYSSAVEILGSMGFNHYEISNYSKTGRESRHNLKYWNCDDYVGFGLAAHSCIGTGRYSNSLSLEKYLSYWEKGIGGYSVIEEDLEPCEFAEEYIMMRMRLSNGLSIDNYGKRFGSGFEKKYLPRMMPFIKSGHIIYDERAGAFMFTTEGMYVSNYILSSILDLGQ